MNNSLCLDLLCVPVLELLYIIKAVQFNRVVCRDHFIDLIVIELPILFIMFIKWFHCLNGCGLIGGQQAIVCIVKNSILQLSWKLFYGLGNNKLPVPKGIIFPDIVRPQTSICTINQRLPVKHLYDFLFSGNCSDLLICWPGMNRHGKRNSVRIHKQAHLLCYISVAHFI